jgi:dTDP-4-amino-4,6-dideoxygalactose transaminase
MYAVPFNKPAQLERHFEFIRHAVTDGYIAGNGRFGRQCEALISQSLGGTPARLVTSATHALETTALLLNLEPGDEVIVPSYTFVSTANAFVLRGARLRFADNDARGNILPAEVERLWSPKTRAVVVMHYGGGSCDLDAVLSICAPNDVPVIEDAAQAVGATYRGRPLGTIGDLGCFSFHETKNITSGEGGAIIFGNRRHVERAQVIVEKGTDRGRFLEGLVDKYTWIDCGSSYVLSELNAAYLYPQLLQIARINDRRREIRETYTRELKAGLETVGVSILDVPEHNTSNHHLMALLMPSQRERNAFIAFMAAAGICCPFHYIPLHSSPFGCRYYDGSPEALPGADRIASTLVRLPLYFNMTTAELARVVDTIHAWLRSR